MPSWTSGGGFPVALIVQPGRARRVGWSASWAPLPLPSHRHLIAIANALANAQNSNHGACFRWQSRWLAGDGIECIECGGGVPRALRLARPETSSVAPRARQGWTFPFSPGLSHKASPTEPTEVGQAVGSSLFPIVLRERHRSLTPVTMRDSPR